MSRKALVATLTAFLGIGLSACTNADGAIFILQNQVAGTGCTISATLGSFQPRGTIDVQATQGYLFNPLVQNNASSSTTNNRVALIEGAEVELSLPSAPELDGIDSSLLKFTQRFSGSIQPGGGLTSFSFVIISKDLLDLLAAGTTDGRLVTVQAKIKIFGTIGGGDVESNAYNYTIDVCDGCMKQNVGMCTDLSADFTASEGGACNLLQDTILECCTKSDSTELCPAAMEETTGV
jgi:hypothetical protein